QSPTPGAPVATTQAALATAVGTAREVVSRRLETWAAKGWIETGRGRVTILDPGALRQIAEAEKHPLL
ncbi:helix-turn-helix domain-containing protein, partial [Shimia sp.]|uniref:helix-turn-helix domain-containing protein n=1 Tax=Shimia sp. TaxID=1954381 RepID=UPI00356410AE